MKKTATRVIEARETGPFLIVFFGLARRAWECGTNASGPSGGVSLDAVEGGSGGSEGPGLGVGDSVSTRLFQEPSMSLWVSGAN